MNISHPEECVDLILERVGRRVVMAVPLGLGKPNHLVNAIYERAKLDSTIELTVFTALTLEAPRPGSELEQRFLGPLIERWYGAYPALAYLADMRAGRLPPNVTITEFYMAPGALTGVPYAQQNYVSTNYTHVDEALADRGVNVIAQMVASEDILGTTRYSLASNPDLTLDVLPAMRQRLSRAHSMLVGQVSRQLPFMEGDAEIGADAFDVLLDNDDYDYAPFPAPARPVTLAEHAIGLRASALVKDGGTLQIGIGSMADAFCHALILRHRENGDYRRLLECLGAEVEAAEDLEPFQLGLYGATEMLVPGFLDLLEAGILKRRVRHSLSTTDVDIVLHAAFYLGPADFYERLRALPETERASINMTAVSYVNELYGNEALKREQRRHARFVNNAMMVTLSGAVVSDGLANGRVISGVGGQYNFVTQAHALEDAHSIIAVNATRTHKGKTTSNIVWEYPHVTIPRHLRDMVVTEYGIARLRARSDRDVIANLLNVCDSRFQEDLLDRAQRAGKIEAGYRIPDAHRNNTPQALRNSLLTSGLSDHLPHFPLGTDMGDAEAILAVAFSWLKQHNAPWPLAKLIARAGQQPQPLDAVLEWLNLLAPSSMEERLWRRLVVSSLAESGVADRPLQAG